MHAESDLLFRFFNGRTPFVWQRDLFAALLSGEFPRFIDIPTAGGKTYGLLRSWLAALVARPQIVPRRLVYVVDRRAVADQVYEDATQLAQTVSGGPLRELISDSVPGVGSSEPLSVYAFRGQRTLDDSWDLSPAQPTILVGTVDMLGSRLLFRGYVGVGNWRRSQAAGLLGQDAWWVLDEPHLAEPLWSLLSSVERVQQQQRGFRPFWISAMGATTKGVDSEKCLRAASVDDSLECRLKAHKETSVWREIITPEEFARRVVAELGARLRPGSPPVSVGVLVSSVKVASGVLTAIEKAKKHFAPGALVVSISGAMRGADREEVMLSAAFQESFCAGKRTRTAHAVLVGTHCLEAGFDGDFDVLISDVSSVPSVLQRLGRLNRVGETPVSHALLFRVKDSRPDTLLADRCHEWFCSNGYSEPEGDTVKWSGSLAEAARQPSLPKTWRALSEGHRLALSEATVASPEFSAEIALLCACSSRDSAPAVRSDLFLRGYEPPDRALLFVAWRTEAALLDTSSDLRDALRLRPVRPQEMAQRSYAAGREFLSRLCARLRKDREELLLKSCWLYEPWSGDVRPAFVTTGETWKPDENAANCVLILPPMAGGYSQGMLDPGSRTSVEDLSLRPEWNHGVDTVGAWTGEAIVHPARAKRCVPPDEVLDASALPPRTRLSGLARELFERSGWAVIRRLEPTSPSDRGEAIYLQEHLASVAVRVRALAEALNLDPDTIAVLEAAALAHDIGKQHHGFQRFLGNTDPSRPIAKSMKRVFGSAGFRHEALSVLECGNPDPLVRLLVGTHHGHGRPLFPADRLPPRIEARGLSAADGQWLRDFATVHEIFSPWAVAWLEALLKAADVGASRTGTESNEHD